MSSLDLTRDWLKNVLRPYPSHERILTEVMGVLTAHRTLQVKTDAFTFDSGQTALLLLIHGTLPITYRGATYQIPINIWIPHEYPRNPPMAFVVPTKEMGVRKSREVDPGGRVREEVVSHWWASWPTQGRDLATLLNKLREIFSLVPPVYAIPASASSAAASTAARSPTASSPTQPSHPSHPPPHGPPPVRAYTNGPGPGPNGEALPGYGAAPAPSPAQLPAPVRHTSLPPHGDHAQPGGPPVSPPVPLRPGHVPPVPARPFDPRRAGTQSPQPYSPVSSSGGGVQRHGSLSGPPGQQPPPPPPPPVAQPYPPQMWQSPPPGVPGVPSHPHQPAPGPAPMPGYPQQPYPVQAYAQPQPGQPGQPGPPLPVSAPPPAPLPAQAPAPASVPVAAPPQRAPDLLSSSSPDTPTTSLPLPDGPAPPVPPSKPPPPSVLHLHAVLLPHLNAALPPLLHSLHAQKAHLEERREDLATGEPAIRDEMARLEAVKKVCDAVGGKMEAVVKAGESRIVELEGRGDVSVDEVVCGISIVHNQLIDLVAEDNALSDTMYHLTRALEAERIDLDRYLKAVRSLAREQYMKRALIERINESMGQASWSA